MKAHINKITIFLFLFLSSLFSTYLLSESRHNADQSIYLLRHAEKQADGRKDPSLTEAGIERANSLVALLKDKNITSIYSTKYKRTLETVTPLAKLLNIDIQQYDPSNLSEFSEQIKTVKGNIVIVGHSNTTPNLTSLISGKATTALDESEYDRLYQIIVNSTSTHLKRLKLSPLQEHGKLGTLIIDPSKFFTGKLTFEMRFKDKAVGTSEHIFKREADAFSIREKTIIKGMGIDAYIELSVNDKTLEPLAMAMSGTMGGPVDINLKWKGNQVSGHSEMSRAPFQTQGKININSAQPENIIERSTAIMLVHLFQLNQDKDTAIQWYGAYADEISHIDIRYLGEEKVTVPAGTFDTYKVRFQGGAPSQIFYIEKGEHPKVVKIEVVSMPWVYHLVSSES